jgi:hypothetical protein
MEGNLDSKRQGEAAPRISTNQRKANITTTKRGISSNRSGSPYMFFARWDSPVQHWLLERDRLSLRPYWRWWGVCARV